MLTAAQRLLLRQIPNQNAPIYAYNPFDFRRQYFPLHDANIPALYNIQAKNYRKPRRHFTEQEIREIVQYHNSNGRIISKTTRFFHIGHQTLNKMLDGTYSKKRKRKTSEEHDEFILNAVSQGFVTAGEIADMLYTTFHLKISHDTITRRLKEANYSFLKPSAIQFLDPDQQMLRMHFAGEMLDLYSDMLECIIFSDESRFCNRPDNLKIWKKKGDACDSFSTIEYSKVIIKTMAWGAIGLNFKSKLYFHRKGVNGTAYIHCLNHTNIFSSLDEQFGNGNYLFQQDGATCHHTDETIHFLLNKCRSLHGWPPNSPDLSPIEMIWAYMKRKLAKLPRAKNVQELEAQLTQIWDEIPIATINKLILSFRYRLEMCRQVGGRSISQFLSNHKHSIPPELRQEPQQTINYEMQDKITQLYIEKGNKWKLISKILEEEYNLKISQKVVRFKAKEIERKCNDFKKYHNYYSKFPKEISVYIKEDDARFPLKIQNGSDILDNGENRNQHVNINIEREPQQFDQQISDVEFSADNSEWSANSDSDYDDN